MKKTDKSSIRRSHVVAPREREDVPFFRIFPQFKDLKNADTTYARCVSKDDPRIPEIDKNYLFPVEQTLVVCNALALQNHTPIWIRGWSGTGKSSLVRQVCARLRLPLYEVEGSSFLQPKHLIGVVGAKDGGTVFEERTALEWLRNGGVLSINEYDTLDPACVNALKPLMEDPPHYNVPELRHKVTGHPDCRVIVTCNTWGSGDTSGLFGSNTNKQSAADLRRFGVFVEIDYMEPEMEVNMLAKYFKIKQVHPADDADMAELGKVVSFANSVRSQFKNGDSDFTLSPAQLVTWCRLAIKLDCGFRKAAFYAFLNTLKGTERHESVLGMLNGIFPET